MESIPQEKESLEHSGVPKKWISMVRVKPLMDNEIVNIIEKEKDKNKNPKDETDDTNYMVNK